MLETTAELVFDRVKNFEPGLVSLVFVDRSTMQAINLAHAGHDYPTDVLSFNYHESGTLPPQGYIGEIVICHEIAADQATRYGLEFKAEVSLLLIHGLLHLSGQDHQDELSQSGFNATQDGIMEELKLKTRQFKWSH